MESASLRYFVYQFSEKTDKLEFLDLNLPKIGFWDRNFKNLGLDSESKSTKDHVCQLSVEIDKFYVFSLNLGKFPNYVQYFGSNAVELDGDRWSWVEAEMS